MKKLDYTYLGEVWPITLQEKQYQNRNLAIQMWDHDDEDGPEPFAAMTVNFGERLPKNQAYLDTNNLPGIDAWVRKHRLGRPLGKERVSGFCTYPLYEFDLARVRQYAS